VVDLKLSNSERHPSPGVGITRERIRQIDVAGGYRECAHMTTCTPSETSHRSPPLGELALVVKRELVESRLARVVAFALRSGRRGARGRARCRLCRCRPSRARRTWSSRLALPVKRLRERDVPLGPPGRVGVGKLNRIQAVERTLRAEQGHEPALREIARELEMCEREVEQIRRSAEAPVSPAKPIGEAEDAEFGDVLADEKASRPTRQPT
jgi:hypothetical protein